MKKNKAMKLVKALRSGVYKQGRGVLVDGKDRFCCLGVACNISNLPLQWKNTMSGDFSIGGEVTELPSSIQEEYGFYSDIGRLRDHNSFMEINNKRYNSLAGANDDGCTFDQIADFIENNYKRL